MKGISGNLTEISLDEAKKQPSNFLYVFASDNYLNAIPAQHAAIISGKRKNQFKLLMLSADKYYGDPNKYTLYVDAIRQSFTSVYGMSPVDALIKLAQGENVAGKDWEKGIYGIGATKTNTFKDITINDGAVTVDPTTGHIFAGSEDITSSSDTIYAEIDGKSVPYQIFSDGLVYTFMAEYNKKDGKYYAKSYTDGETRYDANGKKIKNTDAGSLWENVKFETNNFLQWLKSILELFFGSSEQKTVELINKDNTLPNQRKDGYVYESGLGDAGMIVLALAAGGLLLGGGLKAGKKKKRK